MSEKTKTKNIVGQERLEILLKVLDLLKPSDDLDVDIHIDDIRRALITKHYREMCRHLTCTCVNFFENTDNCKWP